MNVDEVLSALKGDSVVFVPNPGNAGDGLIAAAEYILLRRLGVDFRVADANQAVDVRDCDSVVYGGGGNLIGLYNNAKNYLSSCHFRVRRLVILPHTIRDNHDLIASFGDNVTVFCRETESFDHVRNVNPKLACYLGEDVALLLPVSDIIRRSPQLGFSFRDIINVRFLKRLIRVAHYVVRSRANFSVLNAFRGDVEGRDRGRAGLNIDVSQVFSPDDMSEVSSRETAYSVLKFLSYFDRIRTDRLHVCIAAALLGKRVDFFDNSYGKNSSVYRH